MIKNQQFLEIKRLLQEGKYSQRTIAKRIGVSRTAVKAVLMKITQEAGKNAESRKRIRRANGTQEIVHPAGKPKRCPECGRLVRMPCLACQLREIKRQKFERP